MRREPIRLPRWVGPSGRTLEYAPNEWSAAEAEVRIADELMEWLYVYDPEGRQVGRFRGTADDVDLSDELKARTEGLYGTPLLSDHVVVHNHPPTRGVDAVSSFPPSPSDLLMTVACNLRELVVISGGDRFLLRRPGAHWPTDEDDLVSIVDEIQGEMLREFGLPGPTRAAAIERWHMILVRLQEGGWVSYERTHQTPGL